MAAKVVRLVAAARQYHGGRLLFPGDVFTTTEQEAADLCALAFARRAPAPAAALLAEGIASPPLPPPDPIIDLDAVQSAVVLPYPDRKRARGRNVRGTFKAKA